MDLFSNPPCAVSFAAYRKKTERPLQDNTKYEVNLTCVANNKQAELTDRLDEKLSKYNISFVRVLGVETLSLVILGANLFILRINVCIKFKFLQFSVDFM